MFNYLVKRIESGEVTGILCQRFDRLTRNLPEAGMLVHLMAQGKLQEIRTLAYTFRRPTDARGTATHITPIKST